MIERLGKLFIKSFDKKSEINCIKAYQTIRDPDSFDSVFVCGILIKPFIYLCGIPRWQNAATDKKLYYLAAQHHGIWCAAVPRLETTVLVG